MNSSRLPPKNNAVGALPPTDRTAWLKGGKRTCLTPPRQLAAKPWRIILLGVPGIGKSTQAKLLCERLGTCHLSIRDIFCAASSNPKEELTPAIQNALDYLKRGEIVPDETVLNLVGERLRCLNCSGGFLLDGFPRTVAQAKALEQWLENQDIKLSGVFHYVLPDLARILRIANRRVCSHCNTVYHLDTQPPKAADTCDQCGGNLFQHEDDHPKAIQMRMEAYQKSTEPLTAFYRQHGLLMEISAAGSPEEVCERTQLSALAC